MQDIETVGYEEMVIKEQHVYLAGRVCYVYAIWNDNGLLTIMLLLVLLFIRHW